MSPIQDISLVCSLFYFLMLITLKTLIIKIVMKNAKASRSCFNVLLYGRPEKDEPIVLKLKLDNVLVVWVN